ncbi:MAG: choice-of-anchor I family protein [Flavobacteriales bacterium]
MKKLYFLAAAAFFSLTTGAQSLSLEHVSTYHSGVFGEGAAEIVTFDKTSNKLFFSNANANSVGIIDFSDPTNISLVTEIDLDAYGDGVNSVSAYDGFVAVAVQGASTMDRGKIVFFDASGTFKSSVEVGYLPDMVTFSPDGKYVLVANEGEPSDDWSEDPAGSVSIIDVSVGIASVAQTNVTDLLITDYTGSFENVRNFGPQTGYDSAANYEPEYVTISEDNSTAFVTLQENNAVAVIDIVSKTITDIQPLGFKDHSVLGNGLDASDKDDVINITSYPFRGLYLPDAITTIDINGTTYYLTANEGDSRDYDGYSEEERLKDVDLDSTAFPNAATLQADETGGRIKITSSMGDVDGDGDFDQIYTYGARSFSIWSASGSLIYDSGDQFEQKLKTIEPDNFNSTNDENDSFDNRSDDKGPEPEAIEVAVIDSVPYAFIGLERQGGVMMYNIANPTAPTFVDYINFRDFNEVDPTTEATGDLGVEDVLFIHGMYTTDSNYYIVTSNEVSGTVSVFQIVGAKYNPPVDTTDTNTSVAQINKTANFRIYPNPVSDVLTVSKKGNFTVYDMTGQIVQTANKTARIEVATLPEGLYMIRDERGVTMTFIKQ